MAFGDNARPRDNKEQSQDSIYMKLKGDQFIRILDKTENVAVYWRYYMSVNVKGQQQERSIVVGRGGPIAQYMQEIGKEDKRFRSAQKRILSNVLDREDSKVKVLDYGSTMLGQFTALHKRVRNMQTMEPMNLWDFDLNIVSEEGREPKDVKRNVFPGMDQSPLAADLLALPKFDLSLVARPMPDEMQVRILSGDDLNEILRELNWERQIATLPQ